jgi:hypothetical protein
MSRATQASREARTRSTFSCDISPQYLAVDPTGKGPTGLSSIGTERYGDPMTEPDDFTPRELGSRIGHTWAEMAPMRSRGVDAAEAEVSTVADSGAVPENVRALALAGMGERLHGRADEQAFMDGFVHGVRAFRAGARGASERKRR